MYIDVINNKSNKPATLLRRCYRENGVKKIETIANLSSLPPEIIQNIRLVLKGTKMIPVNETDNSDGLTSEIESTVPWGHVNAVATAMKRLNIANLIDPKPSPERNLVMGLIAARIISPASKLATVSWWGKTTLPSAFDIKKDCTEVDVYNAMDWLLARQTEIEKRLFDRHIESEAMLFVDMSSTYYEGKMSSWVKTDSDAKKDEKNSNLNTQGLIRFGYNRDKKRGKPQINFSLTTDKAGRPLSISVFSGNTSDSSVMIPTVKKVCRDYGVSRAVMVGDRGMISSKTVSALRKMEGLDWITALRQPSIKKLILRKIITLDNNNEYHHQEFSAPVDYPGERLAVCYNPELKDKRVHSRTELIASTKIKLDDLNERVKAGTLKGIDKIGVEVGKIINKYKVKKHFDILISDSSISYEVKESSVDNEACTDGLYVIRTSLPAEAISIEDCIRQYKNLSNVENAFRTMKTVNLRVRPIYHHLDNRIIAHIFLIMLSYYVEFHLREAWRPILFSDDDTESKNKRNPVAPALRSEEALEKISARKNIDGIEVEAFQNVMKDLATISTVKYWIKLPTSGEKIILDKRPKLSPRQAKAIELLEKIEVYS
jgi:transposase